MKDKPTPDSKNYILRNIPPDLWNRIKHVSIDRQESIRQMIFNSLRTSLIVWESNTKKKKK